MFLPWQQTLPVRLFNPSSLYLAGISEILSLWKCKVASRCLEKQFDLKKFTGFIQSVFQDACDIYYKCVFLMSSFHTLTRIYSLECWLQISLIPSVDGALNMSALSVQSFPSFKKRLLARYARKQGTHSCSEPESSVNGLRHNPQTETVSQPSLRR